MGAVTPSALIALSRTLKTQFFSALDKVQMADFEKMVTKVPSDSDQEDYGWLGNVPGISEFLDERARKGLYEFSYSLKNKKWEGTLDVLRDWMEDDKTGQIKVRVNDLAVRAANHPRKLLSEIVIAGAASLCYDGQYFYDTDHASGDSGTQSNKLTGTGTTLAQIKADFIAARKAMLKFVDDRGEIFQNQPLSLQVHCPADLQSTFEELLNSTLISNTSNVLKGAASLVVDPYLVDVNDWYLHNVGSYIKPFIFQDRVPVEFNALDNPETSDAAFSRDVFSYGSRARYNIGYGLWQNSVLTTNT